MQARQKRYLVIGDFNSVQTFFRNNAEGLAIRQKNTALYQLNPHEEEREAETQGIAAYMGETSLFFHKNPEAPSGRKMFFGTVVKPYDVCLYIDSPQNTQAHLDLKTNTMAIGTVVIEMSYNTENVCMQRLTQLENDARYGSLAESQLITSPTPRKQTAPKERSQKKRVLVLGFSEDGVQFMKTHQHDFKFENYNPELGNVETYVGLLRGAGVKVEAADYVFHHVNFHSYVPLLKDNTYEATIYLDSGFKKFVINLNETKDKDGKTIDRHPRAIAVNNHTAVGKRDNLIIYRKPTDIEWIKERLHNGVMREELALEDEVQKQRKSQQTTAPYQFFAQINQDEDKPTKTTRTRSRAGTKDDLEGALELSEFQLRKPSH